MTFWKVVGAVVVGQVILSIVFLLAVAIQKAV